jgi:hypothetical protein
VSGIPATNEATSLCLWTQGAGGFPLAPWEYKSISAHLSHNPTCHPASGAQHAVSAQHELWLQL